MRSRTVLLIGFPAALVVVHTALWVWATGRIRTGLEQWVAQRRAEGWTVTHGEAARGGWPLAASLVVSAPAVSDADVSWQAERVVLRVAASAPDVLAVAPEGGQTVRLGALPPAQVTARELSLDAPLASAGPVALLARDLRVEAAGRAGTVGLLTGRVSQSGDAGAFSISAEAVALPEDLRWVLGPHISSATADGGVTHLDASGPKAWRDAGGAVDVTHLAVGWGPLGVSGTLRADLDAGLQPEGAATLRLVGATAALDAAAAAGVVTQQVAVTAKALVALLQGAQDAGGQLEVPVALKDGTLSAAGVKFARMPAVSWTRD